MSDNELIGKKRFIKVGENVEGIVVIAVLNGVAMVVNDKDLKSLCFIHELFENEEQTKTKISFISNNVISGASIDIPAGDSSLTVSIKLNFEELEAVKVNNNSIFMHIADKIIDAELAKDNGNILFYTKGKLVDSKSFWFELPNIIEFQNSYEMKACDAFIKYVIKIGLF
jgi:hypothetical protein